MKRWAIYSGTMLIEAFLFKATAEATMKMMVAKHGFDATQLSIREVIL